MKVINCIYENRAESELFASVEAMRKTIASRYFYGLITENSPAHPDGTPGVYTVFVDQTYHRHTWNWEEVQEAPPQKRVVKSWVAVFLTAGNRFMGDFADEAAALLWIKGHGDLGKTYTYKSVVKVVEE